MKTRSVRFGSNTGTAVAEVGAATVRQQLTVCVAPGQPADITLNADGSSPIYGSLATPLTVAMPRNGGVLVQSIDLANAAGHTCHPT